MTPVNKTVQKISPHDIAVVVSELSVLQFFPSDKDARTAIAKDLIDICPNIEEARWLSRRVRQLYNEWPGPREIRAVYCSRNKPRDGMETISQVYPDGVPTPKGGSELAWYPAVETTKPLLLPAGHVVSVDLGLENEVRLLAAKKDINRRKPEQVQNPEFQRITQADIDRAVQQNRQKRAELELSK